MQLCYFNFGLPEFFEIKNSDKDKDKSQFGKSVLPILSGYSATPTDGGLRAWSVVAASFSVSVIMVTFRKKVSASDHNNENRKIFFL